MFDLGEEYGVPECWKTLVILSSSWFRVTGMRQSDSEGASNPGLPKMRGSAWGKSDGA